MGCDIHLRLERKAKGQNEWQPCYLFGHNHDCWSDRTYGMFAMLADVRNYWHLEHLPVRGLPKDVTNRTLTCYGCQVADDAKYDWQYSESDAKRWVESGDSFYYEINGIKYCSDPDWHTPSWCTTSEMEDCINKIFRNEDGTYKEDYTEWLALLGAMKGYEMDGSECRAVFWFDN